VSLSTRRWLAGAAIVAALGASGCLGDDERTGSALEGGTASVALARAPASLDPAGVHDPETRAALWLVYTPPLTYRRAEGRKGTELIPGVARSLPEISEDGLTFSLRVRRGLRFSDGRLVRARDVRHSLLRAAAAPGAGGELFADVVSIGADDRSGEVEVRLSRPDPSFPHALAALEAGVVPAGTPMRSRRGSPPVGVGPYRIAQVRPGRGFGLRRQIGFQLPGVPAGLIDAFRLTTAGNAAEQAQAVMGGTLDVMTTPPPVGLLPQLRSELGERYSQDPGLATRYLRVETGSGPFARVALRQALGYALDVPEATRRLAGLALPTCTLLPASVLGYDEPDSCPWGDPGEPAELERARQLVEDSAEEGAVVTLRASPADRAIARLFRNTLTKIGLSPVLLRTGRADVTLSTARAAVPDPARLLLPIAAGIPLDVAPRVVLLADDLASEPDADDAARLATELDRELVGRGLAIPYAGIPRTLFLSARIDADNCKRVHPVYGVDLSSLCVR
jgi:peptide/nickel transport system substrate-binding protein